MGICWPHVHDGSHFHACVQQVQGSLVSLVVNRRHHHGVARLDAVKMNQALGGCGQHDARQVVVLELQRHFVGTGGQYDTLGPDLN